VESQKSADVNYSPLIFKINYKNLSDGSGLVKYLLRCGPPSENDFVLAFATMDRTVSLF
jgi:hypothetical protein